MAYTKTVNLIPAAAYTATTTGTAVSSLISSKPIIGRNADSVGRHMLVMVDVTAATGTTPTLDITVQGQFVPGGNWVTLSPLTGTASAAWTQLTAAGQQVRRYEGPLPLAVRGIGTIGGTTPSFTFTLTAVMGG